MKKLWLKVVLVISIDGKIAFPNGGKSNIGGRGDRRVLEEALSWADATLMGGETLRIHQNTCLIHKEDLLKRRIDNNQTKQPIAIVVSNKNDHSEELPFFKQPINRWLISSTIKLDELSHCKGYDRIIPFNKNWADTLSKVSQIGLTKIVVLGGAKLIGSLLIEDQVDELQLTLSPKIIGGKYSWIPNQINNLPSKLSQSNTWKIKENKNLEHNEIMLNYVKYN